jgi:hypothetical protein
VVNDLVEVSLTCSAQLAVLSQSVCVVAAHTARTSPGTTSSNIALILLPDMFCTACCTEAAGAA